MSYGQISDEGFNLQQTTQVTRSSSTPDPVNPGSVVTVFGQPYVVTGVYKRLTVFRSGSNTPAERVPNALPPPRIVKRTRIVKVGRLTSKAEFNPLVKRKTKTIYAVQTRYLVRKSRQTYTKVYRRPNALYFKKVTTSVIGATSVSSRVPFTDYVHDYVGDVWAPFSTMSGATAGIDPNNFLSPSSAFSDARASLQNELLAKYVDYVAGVEVGLGQIFAERQQTAALFQEACSRLGGAYRQLRKGNLSSAAQTILPTSTKRLANDRLAYKYGVEPLISDLGDILNVLTTAISFKEKFRKRKVQNIASRVISDTLEGGCRTIVTEEGSVEMLYKVSVVVNNPGLLTGIQLGFGPLSLLWELTRWSFVIDKVIPVADRISQFEASLAVTPIHIERTTTIRRRVRIEKTFVGAYSGGYVWSPAKTVMLSDYIEVNRQILPSLPSIDVTVIKDDYQKTAFLLNAAALLRQLIKR